MINQLLRISTAIFERTQTVIREGFDICNRKIAIYMTKLLSKSRYISNTELYNGLEVQSKFVFMECG